MVGAVASAAARTRRNASGSRPRPRPDIDPGRRRRVCGPDRWLRRCKAPIVKLQSVGWGHHELFIERHKRAADGARFGFGHSGILLCGTTDVVVF